jgi:hypothetical protein
MRQLNCSGSSSKFLFVVRGSCLFVCHSSRCERSFSVVSINAIVFPLVDLWSSIAAGVGFGASQSFMFYAPVVARALGPGALFSPHCSAFSTTILAAWNALLFNAMHVLLMIIAFDAYRSMSPPRISAVVVLHAAAASFVSCKGAQSQRRRRDSRATSIAA